MIPALQPYPAYKDSGLEWLGQVPAHWEVRPVRHVAEVINGYPFDSARFSDSCGHPLIRIRDLDRNRTTTRYDGPFVESARIEPGALLVGMDGDFNVGRWLGEAPALLNQRMCHVRANDEVTETFLYYSLARPLKELNDVAWSTTVKHLKSSQVERLRFAWPPLSEQGAIARYLDHATSRIDRYIRSREKLIALLEEQKQTLIHEAVTGRIDVRTGKPYPAYKDSGVEWLGQVPAHWEVRRLKWVTRLQRGYDLPADFRIPGPFPVVSSGGVIGTHAESRCTGPGVVIGRYGSTDAVFFVKQDFWPHNTSLFVTNFHGNSEEWCFYLLGSITKADHAGKSAVPGLDRKDLFGIVVPVPPMTEQQAMVSTIDGAVRKLRDAISGAEQETTLAHEYRTRLIADVVTGKLDVREAAAALPDAERSGMSSTRHGCESLIGGKR